MSTTTAPATTVVRHDLSLAGIINSEWIKFRSVPSTWWLLAVVAALTIGVGTQSAAMTSFAHIEGGMPQPGIQAAGVLAVSGSTDMSVVIVSVLGVLVIAGEYTTGMIRSSFTAVPRRVPVLVAKALILAAATFVVSAASVAITIPISLAVLAGNGVDVHLDDPYYWSGIFGSVLYTVLLALIAFGISAIVRSVVVGLATTLGLVIVLPIALGFVPGGFGPMIWLQNVSRLLPFNLGRAAYTHPGQDVFNSPNTEMQRPEGLWELEPWQGVVGLVVWVVALFTVAVVLVRRRDA
ncbi:ABC transporter permease [Microbacterium sp. NPDC089695]|uniref:ABC transporter permease n=1 Tax=Microbacterium sp. NPDC089695 TaxID=3364198 RepID=UPI0037FE4BA5